MALLRSLPEAQSELGIGRSTIYKLIATGDLATVKIGRRQLVAQAELERFVRDLQQPHSNDAA